MDSLIQISNRMVYLIPNFICQTICYLTIYGFIPPLWLVGGKLVCSLSAKEQRKVEQFVVGDTWYSVGCAVHELGTTLYFVNTFNFFLSNFLKEFMLMIMSELNFERMFQTQGLCLSFYKYNSFRFFRGCFQPCLAGRSTLHIFRSQFEPETRKFGGTWDLK